VRSSLPPVAGARRGRRRFLTTWCVDAAIESVFQLLDDSAGYPRWWKGVRSVEVLEPGDAVGVGELDRFV